MIETIIDIISFFFWNLNTKGRYFPINRLLKPLDDSDDSDNNDDNDDNDDSDDNYDLKSN